MKEQNNNENQNNGDSQNDNVNQNNQTNENGDSLFNLIEKDKRLDESEMHHHHHHHSDESSSSHSHHHHHHHHHKKKSSAKQVFLGIITVILALVLVIAGTFFVLKQNGDKSLTADISTIDIDNTVEYNGHTYQYNENIISVAFLGVDKEDLGTENGTIGTAGQSDTDMVVAFDKSTGETKLICIPRETMVDVDVYSEKGNYVDTEELQLCLSYAYGDGKETSCDNVITSISRILYGVPVEKYFALDLDGIGAINDSVGGVTLESLYDFNDEGIKKGDTVHIEGDFAETYVRFRTLDSVDASLNRLERQKQYIRAFVAQTASNIKTDFSTVSKLYNTASGYSCTNLTLGDLTYLASTALSKGTSSFEVVSINGEMKEKEIKNSTSVNAAFYPDEDELYKTVLDIYYTQID